MHHAGRAFGARLEGLGCLCRCASSCTRRSAASPLFAESLAAISKTPMGLTAEAFPLSTPLQHEEHIKSESTTAEQWARSRRWSCSSKRFTLASLSVSVSVSVSVSLSLSTLSLRRNTETSQLQETTRKRRCKHLSASFSFFRLLSAWAAPCNSRRVQGVALGAAVEALAKGKHRANPQVARETEALRNSKADAADTENCSLPGLPFILVGLFPCNLRNTEAILPHSSRTASRGPDP